MILNCHCGNVQIVVGKKPQSLTSCNCSTCNRYGALWGYYQPEDVTIRFEAEETNGYSWGDKMIDFHHCGRCGCVTHYETTEKMEKSQVVVNFRMAAPKEIADVQIRHFDGADSWTFLD